MIEEKKQEDIETTVGKKKKRKKERCLCKIRNKSAAQNMIQ